MQNLKDKFKNVTKKPLFGLNYFESLKKSRLKNKYIKAYKKITLFDKKIPVKKKEIATRMIEDIGRIYEALLDLNKVSIHYSIYLVGGAVRDFLLNKEIKDLDMLIIVHYSEFLSPEIILEKLNIDVSKIKAFTPVKDQYGNMVYLTQEQKIYEIVLHILNKYLTIEKGFSPSINVETNPEDYGSRIIQGVIKLKDDKLNYPMDILLSYAKMHKVLQNFDIGLCEAAIKIVDVDYTKLGLYNFPETPRDLYDNLLLTSCFINDMLNKTLTINVNSIMREKLISTLSSHLPRLMEKYPDYNYNFIMTPIGQQSDDDYADQLHKLLSLQEQQEKQNIVNNWLLNRKLTSFSENLEKPKETKSKVIKI